MSFKLMKLPFEMKDLEPYISKETLEFHWGKHHKKYVTTLNELIAGTPYEKMELEEIIRDCADGAGAAVDRDDEIFNNAAQVWNHDFFWKCLTPDSRKPDEERLNPIIRTFGSLQDFKTQFTEAAKKLFGSGWVWLVKKSDQALAIQSDTNAINPLTRDGEQAILCLDVWEHAYYLDYQNERAKFINQFWKIVNWDFVADNLSLSEMPGSFYRQPGRETVVQHH